MYLYMYMSVYRFIRDKYEHKKFMGSSIPPKGAGAAVATNATAPVPTPILPRNARPAPTAPAPPVPVAVAPAGDLLDLMDDGPVAMPAAPAPPVPAVPNHNPTNDPFGGGFDGQQCECWCVWRWVRHSAVQRCPDW